MQETRENKTEYDTHLQNYAAIHLRAKARRFLAENFLKMPMGYPILIAV